MADQVLDKVRAIREQAVKLVAMCDEMLSPKASTPAPAQSTPGLENVKKQFNSDLQEMLSFKVEGDAVIIKPKRFLGNENFIKIAAIVRGLGGDYISAAKDSHFRVPI